MLYVAAIDNDQEILDILYQYSKNYSSTEEVKIDLFLDGNEFIKSFDSQYDLILTDINMPSIGGLELASLIREKDKNVSLVFLTNYAKYAIDGYKFNALDFLLKPISELAFATLLNRIKDKKSTYTISNKFIWVKAGANKIKVNLEDIIYVDINSHILTIHTENENISFKGTIKDIEKEIDSSAFSKCNACFLVNLNKVIEFSNEEVTLSNNEKLAISRNKKQEFLNDLTSFVNR